MLSNSFSRNEDMLLLDISDYVHKIIKSPATLQQYTSVVGGLMPITINVSATCPLISVRSHLHLLSFFVRESIMLIQDSSCILYV